MLNIIICEKSFYFNKLKYVFPFLSRDEMLSLLQKIDDRINDSVLTLMLYSLVIITFYMS